MSKDHLKPGLPGGIYKPLSDSDARRIAESSFEVLEKSGVAVYSKSALDAYKKAGASVDEENNLVKLPRAMVEDAIESNPSSITLHARNNDFDAVLEKNRVHYGTGGTAIYVLDPDTGERRQSHLEDVVLNARLVEELENVHVFTINVFPNEIPAKDEIDVNRFYHSLNNTTKHVMGGIYSLEGCKKVVNMCETVAGGADALRKEPFVSFITLIISPFKVDKDYGEMTCFFADKGLPVVVPTEPMCGTTSPVTLASNVLTHTAETLAGITLVQSVNKGAPGICGSVGSISDLRSMSNLAGSIERGMINSAVAQMAQYFEIPIYATAGTSDAKEVDVQCTYESALSSLITAMSGANYIHDIAGLMEFDLTVSYEKLVIDNEILGMCQRILRGIEVEDDTLGVDLLLKKGPGKDYLAEPHTVKHMRDEFFTPKLSNRQKREAYRADDTAMARAKNIIKRVRETDPQPCLSADMQKNLKSKYSEIREV